MIYKVIKTLTQSGISDITIVLGGESVGDFIRLLGDGSEFNVRINYVYQQKAGGIAEALYLTKEIVQGHKIAVILGDNIFEGTFKEEVEKFKTSNDYECMLFLKNVTDPHRFGVAEVNEEGVVINIEEKPKKPKSNLCVTGLYFYNEEIFSIIEEVLEDVKYSNLREIEITDVNNFYIKRGKTNCKKIEKFWSDAGSFETLIKSSKFIQSKIQK